MLVFTSFVFVVYECYCLNHERPHAWASSTQPTCSAQFCCLYAHEHSHRSRVEGGVESPVTAVPMKGRCEESISSSICLLCFFVVCV